MFSVADDSFDTEDGDFLTAALALDSQFHIRNKQTAKRKSFEFTSFADQNAKKLKQTSPDGSGLIREIHTASAFQPIRDAVTPSHNVNIPINKCPRRKSETKGSDSEEIPDDVLASLDGNFSDSEPQPAMLRKPTAPPSVRSDLENRTPKRSSFTFKKKRSPNMGQSSGMKSFVSSQISSTPDICTPVKDIMSKNGNARVTSTPVSNKTPPLMFSPSSQNISPAQDPNFQSRISVKLSCFKRDDSPVVSSCSAAKTSIVTSSNMKSQSAVAPSSGAGSGRSDNAVTTDINNMASTESLPVVERVQLRAAGNQLRSAHVVPSRTGMVPVASTSLATVRYVVSMTKSNEAHAFQDPPKPSHSSGIPSGLLQQLSTVPCAANDVSNTGSSMSKTPVSTRLSAAPHVSHDIKYDTPPTSEAVRNIGSVTSVSSSVSGGQVKGKRKRKFPGPAGVLPKLKSGQSLAEMGAVKAAESPVVTSHQVAVEVPSSQSTEDRFLEEQWLTMRKELEPRATDILKQFDVASVLRKASRKQLPRGKVPVICVMLDQVNTQNADASVVIRDPSGEMKGTIHRQLVKEYPTELQSGSVLVLRQCGVFSPSAKSHYLNITPKNLVRLYPKHGDTNVAIKINDFVDDDFVIPEPLQPKSAWASPGPSHGQLNQSSPYSVAGMPFSVIGNPSRQTPPYRNPSVPNGARTLPQNTGRMLTPNTVRAFHPSTGKTFDAGTGRTFTPNTGRTFTPNTGRTFTPNTGRTFTPNTGRTFTPNTGRTFTPNTGRTFTPNTGRTFTPNTGRTFTPNTGRTFTPNTGGTFASRQTEGQPEPPADTSAASARSDNHSVEGYSTSKTNTCDNKADDCQKEWDTRERIPLVPKNVCEHGQRSEWQPTKASSAESKNTERLEFSIQEDMDDLLKGLDEEIFSDM